MVDHPKKPENPSTASTAAASPCFLWQLMAWFLVITCMGWILMVFFCIGASCTSLETPPYRDHEECEINQSRAVDAILSVEGITFFQVRCEAEHKQV